MVSIFFKISKTNLLFLVLSFCFIGCKKKVLIKEPKALGLPVQAIGKNLYSISKQGSNLYIAGDGLILKSPDNGDSWLVAYENSSMYFFDVKFSDSQIGYAVGWPKGGDQLNKVSSLFKTIDGGANWFLLYSSSRPSSASTKFIEGDMRNGSIDFLDESRLIWGCGTTQFYSVTGGRGNHCTKTALQTYSSILPNINKAFFGSSGLLESLHGGVDLGISGYQSSDYYDLDLVTSNDIYSITWTNSGSELIKIKSDQTNTSSVKPVSGASAEDKFYGLDFLDVNFGLIVGTSGKIAYTGNSGDSWDFINSNSKAQLNDVLFINNNDAIAIGNNGTLLKISLPNSTSKYNSNIKINHDESQKVWSKVNSNTYNDLYDVEFKNGTMYVVGDGVILKSTNQGSTFDLIYENSNLFFRDISFVDSNTGWVIAFNSLSNQIEVYKTINGGLKWALQTSLKGSSPGIIVGMVVEALNSNYILASYAFGVTSVKKISNDGGVTWSNVGGNYEVAPIADFIFFGSNFTTTGHQGFGPKLSGGGSYVAQNLDDGAGGDGAGCNSLTYSSWVKDFGMNSISSSQNHLAIARDMDYMLTSKTMEGLIERSKVAYPTKASDWGCYETYTDVHYYGIKMVSATEIWLSGENGVVITTKNRNGGIISSTSASEPQKEWYGHNTGTHEHLYDIETAGNDIFIAVGKKGTIIRSN